MKTVLIGCYDHVGVFLNALKEKGIILSAFAPGGADENYREFYEKHLSDTGVKFYNNYMEMLEKEKPVLAGVCPIVYKIGKITCEVLRKGINCISEKPLALTLDEVENIKEAQSKTGAKVISMLEMRYHKPFYTLHKMVSKGVIEEPLMVSVQKSYKIGNRASHFSKRETYGGTIPYIGSHIFDLTRWISGKELESVYAYHTNKGNNNNGEMEAIVSCLFKLKGGGTAVNHIDYLRPATAKTWGDNRMRIAGTRGVIETIDDKVTLIDETNVSKEIEQEEVGSPFVDFITMLEEGGSSILNTADCIKIAEICIRSRESADKGIVVTL
ncbi:MAG TPA: Gfo/Idh/MocA family oxidoreductase [Clostridiales bacterium]|nr:Gfo/Idh/MocA family oxidoreductase [Clostridiales bacterium]